MIRKKICLHKSRSGQSAKLFRKFFVRMIWERCLTYFRGDRNKHVRALRWKKKKQLKFVPESNITFISLGFNLRFLQTWRVGFCDIFRVRLENTANHMVGLQSMTIEFTPADRFCICVTLVRCTVVEMFSRTEQLVWTNLSVRRKLTVSVNSISIVYSKTASDNILRTYPFARLPIIVTWIC